ncbi:MAG: zinc ribbon domain-containing protein [Fibrobacteria bacterium]|nr:zinc ribbon domain-containing protein [Fibrobacteria bacterium]
MPIYEFYCRDCHAVYQFFSKTVSPEKIPPCPKHDDHAPLERQMSRFAMGRSTPKASSGEEGAGETGGTPMDDPRTEARMMEIMSRMEGMDENDGRAMGRMMRELTELTGEGGDDPAMQEAIRRLESGEDPEKVEEIVGDAWGDAPGGAMGEPSYDGGMYDM